MRPLLARINPPTQEHPEVDNRDLSQGSRWGCRQEASQGGASSTPGADNPVNAPQRTAAFQLETGFGVTTLRGPAVSVEPTWVYKTRAVRRLFIFEWNVAKRSGVVIVELVQFAFESRRR